MAEKKFVRMLRTQTGDHGTHHADVIYQVEPKVAKTFDLYIKRKFAEAVSAKDLKKIVEEAKAPLDKAAEKSGDTADKTDDGKAKIAPDGTAAKMDGADVKPDEKATKADGDKAKAGGGGEKEQ